MKALQFTSSQSREKTLKESIKGGEVGKVGRALTECTTMMHMRGSVHGFGTQLLMATTTVMET